MKDLKNFDLVGCVDMTNKEFENAMKLKNKLDEYESFLRAMDLKDTWLEISVNSNRLSNISYSHARIDSQKYQDIEKIIKLHLTCEIEDLKREFAKA